jgi:hypothetical protein
MYYFALVTVKNVVCFHAAGVHKATLQVDPSCVPFDDHRAILDNGFWQFSMSYNISHPNCSRTFELPVHGSPHGRCGLHRFTGHEARECLRGKHVVFIGDSLTRHQMEALTILLETGHRGEPVTGDATPHAEDFPKATNYNGCGTGPLRCDVEARRIRGDVDGIVKNRYYHNTQTKTNLTAFGLYKYAAGHFPVGWRPPTVPFNRTMLGWQHGGIPAIAQLIQQWFGRVDVLVVNVGIWARARTVSTAATAPNTSHGDDSPQRHYLYGPVDKAIEELRLLQPLSRQVKVEPCGLGCDRDRYGWLFLSHATVCCFLSRTSFTPRRPSGRLPHCCKHLMAGYLEMNTTLGLLQQQR